MNVHSIFFSKPHLQKAQLQMTICMDHTSNITLVITLSSYFNLDTNTWCSSIANGQALQGQLNATISPQGLSLITKTTHGGAMPFHFTKQSAIKKGGPLEEIKIVIIQLKWNAQDKCMILIGFLFYWSHGVSGRQGYRIDGVLSRGALK